MLNIRSGLLAAAGLLALTSVASSADMAPVYKSPPPPPPVFSWTGFYIGAIAGGGWSTTEAAVTGIDIQVDCIRCPVQTEQSQQGLLPGGFNVPVAQTQANGFLAGGTVGYNWQMSPWLVLGVEGDIAWTDIKGTSPCLLLLACSVNHRWMATAAGRVGFTRDRLMVYFKGGVAWADTRYSASIDLGEEFSDSVSVKKTRLGALFGTGIEYAFLSNWSAKIEYNYIDFGHKNYTFDLFGGDILIGTKINERMHVVKGGLNWRFNSPVTGPY